MSQYAPMGESRFTEDCPQVLNFAFTAHVSQHPFCYETFSPHRSRVWFATMALLWLVVCSPRQSFATETRCRNYFQAQQFQKAGACYEALYVSVAQTSSSEELRKLLQDRYLYQASVAYYRQAKTEQQVERRGFFTEKAMSALKQSLAQGLCKESNRCLEYRQRSEELRQSIQYTDLIVTTQDENANITVRGFHYQETRRKNFQQELRPGGYQVLIETPGRPVRRTQIQLRGGKPLFLNVTPVQIKVIEKRIIVARQIPPLVLTGYIAGSLLVAGGAVLLIYGVGQQASLNARLQNPKENKDLSDKDYRGGMMTAQTLGVVGSIAAGLGIVALVSGAVAHVVTRQQKARPPRLTPSVQMGVFEL